MRKLRQVVARLISPFVISTVADGAKKMDGLPDTTASAIAIVNLDQQIVQAGSESGVEELLLLRSRFLGDYDALGRATRLSEARFATVPDLLRRSHTRSAVHRFSDAFADLAAAEQMGADPKEILLSRVSILVATGHASVVIAELEKYEGQNPGYASRGALATAYAAVGRLDEADRLYAAALNDLDTTLPFPFAWIYFARGLMWSEQGNKPERGEAMYRQALAYVPEFAPANVNLAELEAARGDTTSAIEHLQRTLPLSNEPEALALLGVLYKRTGRKAEGDNDILLARQRYESLLASHPLAFADHAAEFYLGPGADAERAWTLAQQNLANRETDRAVALAVKAAEATGRYNEACELLMHHGPSVSLYLRNLERTIPQ
jgi:tetratricopeptide (TPR) repeat protein